MTDLFNLLQRSPVAFTTTATIVGLMVGSFLNVVIHRLPRMMQRDWNDQAAMILEDATLDRLCNKVARAQATYQIATTWLFRARAARNADTKSAHMKTFRY